MKPPSILHGDVKGVGCVELEVDIKTARSNHETSQLKENKLFAASADKKS